MIKKRIERFVAMLLCFGIIAGLCACGGTDKAMNTKKVEVEQYSGKEFVYVPSYVTLNDNGYIADVVINNGRAYFSSAIYSTSNSQAVQKIRYIDLDDSNLECKDTAFVSEYRYEDTDYQYLVALAAMSDGKLVVTLGEASSTEADEKYYLVFLDEEGNELNRVDITQDIKLEDVDFSYPYTLLVDKNDNIIISDNQNCIWTFDKDGAMQKKTNLDGNWIGDFAVGENGTLLFYGWGDGSDYSISSIDIETGEINSKILGYSQELYSISDIIKTEDGTVYGKGREGLYELDIDNGQYEEVIKWLDSDLIGDDLSSVFALDGDEFGTIISENIKDDECRNEFAILRKTPVSEMPVKELISLGTISASSDIEKLISKYNRKSTKYRVEVKDYFKDADEDYSKAVENFNNDVLAGVAPDVIDIESVNALMFISKDLFVDLGKLLDEDPDVAREDYFESVLASRTTENGLLYAIPSSFALISLAGRTEDLGDTTFWTISEMKQAIENHPELKIIEYADKETALSMFLYTNYGYYINWEDGTCNFDSEQFKEVLNVVNMFPSKIPESEYNDYDELKGPMEHTALLAEAYISSFSDVQLLKKEFKGDDITYVGFPDVGTAIMPIGGYAINAMSDNIDAAWDFVKSNIVKECYTGDKWRLPTHKGAFKEAADSAMVKTMALNENGEEIEISNYSIGTNNYSFDIYAMTEDEYETLIELIEKAKGNVNYDDSIYAIIDEEAGPFFEGEKSVDEAASIIQSRIQIYVDETR